MIFTNNFITTLLGISPMKLGKKEPFSHGDWGRYSATKTQSENHCKGTSDFSFKRLKRRNWETLVKWTYDTNICNLILHTTCRIHYIIFFNTTINQDEMMNFCRSFQKQHSCKLSFQKAEWFHKSTLKCKTHMTFCLMGLIRRFIFILQNYLTVIGIVILFPVSLSYSLAPFLINM